MFNFNILNSLILFNGIAFISYGLLVLTTDHMVKEFTRYGLIKFRKLTGVLEFLGGLGAIVGLLYPPLLLFSTGGLFLLMLLGTVVRLRLKDPPLQIIPAFVLMILNGHIFYHSWIL
jgi:hypothetical protein